MTLRERLRALAGRRFVREVGIVQASQAVTAVLGFATSIVLVRHLGEDGFGIFTLAIATFGVLRILADLGGDPTVIPRLVEARARDDRPSMARHLGYYLVVMGVLALWLPPLVALASPVVETWGEGYVPVVGLVAILSLTGLAELPFRVQNVAAQGLRRFDLLARATIHAQVARFGLLALGAILGLGVAGLTWLQVAAAAASSAIACVLWPRLGSAVPSIREALSRWREVEWRRNLGSGVQIALAKDVPTLYDKFPFLVLGAFHALGDVTRFKLALGLVGYVVLFVGPISQPTTVQLAQAFGRRDADALRRAFYKITWTSLAISAGLGIALAVVAPLLVLAYGAEYLDALPLVYLMLLHPMTAGLGVATAPLLRTLERMATANRIQIPLALAILGAGWFLIRDHGVWGAAVLIVVLRLALRAASFLLCVRLLAREDLVPDDGGSEVPAKA